MGGVRQEGQLLQIKRASKRALQFVSLTGSAGSLFLWSPFLLSGSLILLLRKAWPTHTHGPLAWEAEGSTLPCAIFHIRDMEFANSVTGLLVFVTYISSKDLQIRAGVHPTPSRECTIRKKGLEGASFVFFQQASLTSGRTQYLQWTICARLVSS